MFGFNKYHYSYIYKIVCLDPNIDDFYIGSTISLSNRCNSHMRNSVNKKQKKIYDCKLYTFIRDSGGYENWEMQVIKLYKCETRKELHKEEQKYIDELKPSLNTDNPYKTEEEKKKQVKKYYEDNKEIITAKAKKHRDENQEKIQEMKKKWYEENKERMKEKIECECGSVIRKSDKPTHNRTKKHQAYLNNLSS